MSLFFSRCGEYAPFFPTFFGKENANDAKKGLWWESSSRRENNLTIPKSTLSPKHERRSMYPPGDVAQFGLPSILLYVCRGVKGEE
jgi:hypothetical protein